MLAMIKFFLMLDVLFTLLLETYMNSLCNHATSEIKELLYKTEGIHASVA